MVSKVHKCARWHIIRLDVHPGQFVRERDSSLARMRMAQPRKGARPIHRPTREQRPRGLSDPVRPAPRRASWNKQRKVDDRNWHEPFAHKESLHTGLYTDGLNGLQFVSEKFKILQS